MHKNPEWYFHPEHVSGKKEVPTAATSSGIQDLF